MAAATASTQHSQSMSRQPSSRAGSSRSSRQSDVYDRFYGHREVSELSESVITALFACPLDSASSTVNTPPSNCNQRNPTPRLAEFIAYALHRTRLPDEITFQALFLLRRLKSRFPAARGSSGHRLFISALMLASKSSCDDTYSNKSWTVVSQGLFSLREVNQMERELFGYLAFKVNVEMEDLTRFRKLLMTGDILSVVDCVSPNPATVDGQSSPALDRGCDTPTAIQTRPTSISVDSAPVAHAYKSSSRRTSRASVSSYPVEVSGPSAAAIAQAVSAAQARNSSSPAFQYHPYQQGVGYLSSSNDTNFSPSSESFSSRGSFSSASGYSMTPSPSSQSHSEASSSQNTPPTPPVDDLYADGSNPWDVCEEKTLAYQDQPAGTYDSLHQYIQSQGKHTHIYSSSTNVEDHGSRHPYHV